MSGMDYFERNNYFYGKLMTVRDFKAEQDYMNWKRQLLNLLIHGTGVVYGLDVTPMQKLDGNPFMVKLSPGLAIDCCGHEMFLNNEAEFPVTVKKGDQESYFLYMKYEECLTEKVPAVANPCACEATCCNNRVVEKFSLKAINSDAPDTLWEKTLTKDDLQTNGVPWPHPDSHPWLNMSTSCSDCNGLGVFLCVLKSNGDQFSPDDVLTKKYRSIVFSNPILFRLINAHLLDIRAHGLIKTITGVESDGNGDLKLNEGKNIIITKDIGNHAITISSDPNPDTVTSVGINKKVGASDKYAREDHVHDIEDKTIGIGKLDNDLSLLLKEICMYVRERALKCAVRSLKEVGTSFNNKKASALAYEVLTKGVNEHVYEEVKSFIELIYKNEIDFIKRLESVAKDIQGSATESSFNNFKKSVEDLKAALKYPKKDPCAISIARSLDEVCFYAQELEKSGPSVPGKVIHDIIKEKLPTIAELDDDEIEKAKKIIDAIPSTSSIKHVDLMNKTSLSEDEMTKVIGKLKDKGLIKITTKKNISLVTPD